MHTSLIIITNSNFHHQQTLMMKSEVSGLTSYNNIPITRKRPRESTYVGAGADFGGAPPLLLSSTAVQPHQSSDLLSRP
ncbi:hypothetical protein LINPERHAP2_LOCUS4497 [Linum perenne]